MSVNGRSLFCPVLPGRKCQTGDKTPWTVPRWLGSFELCWASGNGCSLQPRRKPRAPQVVLFLLPHSYQILPGMLQANSALEVREDFKARQAGLGPLLGFAFWILNSLLRSRGVNQPGWWVLAMEHGGGPSPELNLSRKERASTDSQHCRLSRPCSGPHWSWSGACGLWKAGTGPPGPQIPGPGR